MEEDAGCRDCITDQLVIWGAEPNQFDAQSMADVDITPGKPYQTGLSDARYSYRGKRQMR